MVHEHDLGIVCATTGLSDRCGNPIPIHAERTAARPAVRDRPAAVRPVSTLIRRLVHVRLKPQQSLAAVQVTEIDRVRLVGREAIVAAPRVRGRDLRPARPVIGRGIGHRPAAGGGVVQSAQAVGDDRRLAAVSTNIRDAVRGGRAGQSGYGRARCRTHSRGNDGRDAHKGQSAPAQKTRGHSHVSSPYWS